MQTISHIFTAFIFLIVLTSQAQAISYGSTTPASFDCEKLLSSADAMTRRNLQSMILETLITSPSSDGLKTVVETIFAAEEAKKPILNSHLLIGKILQHTELSDQTLNSIAKTIETASRLNPAFTSSVVKTLLEQITNNLNASSETLGFCYKASSILTSEDHQLKIWESILGEPKVDKKLVHEIAVNTAHKANAGSVLQIIRKMPIILPETIQLLANITDSVANPTEWTQLVLSKNAPVRPTATALNTLIHSLSKRNIFDRAILDSIMTEPAVDASVVKTAIEATIKAMPFAGDFKTLGQLVENRAANSSTNESLAAMLAEKVLQTNDSQAKALLKSIIERAAQGDKVLRIIADKAVISANSLQAYELIMQINHVDEPQSLAALGLDGAGSSDRFKQVSFEILSLFATDATMAARNTVLLAKALNRTEANQITNHSSIGLISLLLKQPGIGGVELNQLAEALKYKAANDPNVQAKQVYQLLGLILRHPKFSTDAGSLNIILSSIEPLQRSTESEKLMGLILYEIVRSKVTDKTILNRVLTLTKTRFPFEGDMRTLLEIVQNPATTDSMLLEIGSLMGTPDALKNEKSSLVLQALDARAPRLFKKGVLGIQGLFDDIED